MPSEFPMNDPRNIWQTQPTEPFKMPADEVRRRAQQLHLDSRRKALFSIALGSILCLFFAWAGARGSGLILRMGWAVLSLWSAYFAYHTYRWTWPAKLAPDAAMNACVEFYRNELERRRDYAGHVWRKSGLTFCFLGLAMVLAPALIASFEKPRLLIHAAPFFSLLAIWVAAFVYLQKRNRRQIQQEIDELRAFEREGR